MLSALLLLSQSNPATTPIPVDAQWWKDRHAGCVEATNRGGFDVAFIGDSITQGWEGEGKGYWAANIAPLKAWNFGFSGDRTEHVLWRLNNGEVIGAKPKLIVIMIGTNNIGHGSSTPEQAAEGVRAIVKALRDRTPSSKILLLATFPRDQKADGGMRTKVAKMVDSYKSVADGQNVVFLDIRSKFISQDGTIQSAIMPDMLHFSPAGYQIWGDNMMPTIKQLLGS